MKIAVSLAVLVVFLTAPAFAQSIQIGPGGVQLVPPPRLVEPGPRPRYEVDRREAARIARENGMTEIDTVRQNRRGWVVEGSDRNGDDLTVRMDPDGRVFAVE